MQRSKLSRENETSDENIEDASSFRTCPLSLATIPAPKAPDSPFCFVETYNRERKRADTIGTVLAPWVGYFQC